MNVALSPEGRWLGVAIAGIILAWAAWRLPWDKVRGDAEAQRIFAIFIAVIILLRAPSTQSVMGINLHFLGASIATLLFGAPFALWVMAVVSLLAWLGGTAWIGWAPDFIACGLLPVTVAHLLWRFEQARLPPHLLIFVLFNGFLGGGLAMLASHLLKAVVALWLGIDNPAVYLTAGMLMMFGEGFLCGGTMALVVVYRPHWCASFDDRRYLRPPGGDAGA